MTFQSGPVTETQASASIIVDPELFVYRFVDTLHRTTDAHLLYAVLGAYAAIAVTTPPNLLLHGLGGTTTANFWAMLIGPSGDRKSHVVGITRELLAMANPALVSSGDPGSEEAFYTLVAAQPTQLWPMLEMGKFLSGAQKNSYLAKIKPTMTDLFDGQSQTRVLRKETYSIVNPRISVLAAVTPHFLGEYSAPDDWEGGFLSRFAFGWAKRERTYHTDIGAVDVKSEWYPKLAARLFFLSQQKANPCVGIEDDAMQLWNDWAEDFKQRTDPYLFHLGGQRERIYLFVRKLILLNAWDTGLARIAGPWKVRRYEMEASIRLGEICWQSVMQLSYLATKSKDVRDRRAIVSVLSTSEWMTAGAISRAVPEVGLKKRQAEVTETLVEERAVLKMDRNAQTFYRLATSEEVERGGLDLAASNVLPGSALTGAANGAPSEPAAPGGQILQFPGGG